MKREVSKQEALTEVAAAKLKLETMQQLLVLKEQLLSSKDDQINFQILLFQTQLAYRFGSHSEKSFEQLSLFDDLDDDFFPEAEMLTEVIFFMIFPVKRVKEELNASKHQITVGIDRKELITVRAGGIEIDIPITTEETTLFKILQTVASI